MSPGGILALRTFAMFAIAAVEVEVAVRLGRWQAWVAVIALLLFSGLLQLIGAETTEAARRIKSR